jgi:5-methylthioadenosine/S-adenosylhomocysteine deaminase
MSVLIRQATILTLEGKEGLTPFVGDLLIDKGRIAGLAKSLPGAVADTTIDGTGKLVMPGLVDAHFHSGDAFLRGRYEKVPLELWMLYCYPIILGPTVSNRLLYLRSALVAMESLKNGATTLSDDFIDRPFQSLDRLGEVFGAYEQAGIRASVSCSVADLNAFDTMAGARDLIPAELQAANNRPPVDIPGYLDYCRSAFKTFHGRADRLRVMMGPSGPQRCSPKLLEACSAMAVEYGAPMHMHLLETRMQAVTGQFMYGKTLVEHLHAIGALTPNLCGAHGVWVTEGDIELLGKAGASISHNALSNLKLGSGVAKVRKLMNAGVNVALGTDGYCASESARIFEVMKAAATLQNVQSADYEQWLGAGDILRAATINGARSAQLGDEVGSLKVGKQADLLCLDLRSYNFFPPGDVTKQLVYSENGRSLDWVMVQGEIVVRNGKPTKIDEAAIHAELAELVPPYLEAYARTEEANHAYAPYFAELLRRSRDVKLAD